MAKKREVSAGSFYDQLTQALENFNQPQWLGEHSPLAAPYFLGEYLLKQPKLETEQAIGRGKALQRLLREATETLTQQGELGLRFQSLLKLTFFESKPLLDITDALHIGRAQYYRDRPVAIQALGEAVVQLLHPALRLEAPLPPPKIFGRDELITTCLASVRQRQMLRITGPGGIGKTVLAAQLAAQLAPQPTFWFTFHIGLNDRLNSLLFSIAYFLQHHGAPDLWLQLVADKGQIDLKVVLGLLRHDLEKLQESSPIFCFDEVDLLRPEVEAHAQILNFLESLPKTIAILVIGQQISIATDVQYELGELSLQAINNLLGQAQISLSYEHLERLGDYTKGNPRLLTLFIALQQAGEDLADVLAQMTGAPSLEDLLNRVWRRLEEREHYVLMDLAVYRRPAPSDAWSNPHERFALQQLNKRQLVQSDNQGGISILAAFRELIYKGLSPDNRDILHLNAALTLADRHEYTEAAYHCREARRPELSIRLWYPHRTLEINQGQAEAALTIFHEIAHNQLQEMDRQLLVLIRSELWNLKGDYALARADLHATLWNSNILKARADRIKGDVAEIYSEFDAARLAYQDGLVTVENLLEKEVVLFHRDLGWIYRRQKSFDLAWREALLARYEVENLQGHIQRDQGHFDEAQAHYLEALALAKALGHTQGEAKTNNTLANAFAQLGKFAEATLHWEEAYQCFRRIGQQSSLASVRVNQATGYILMNQPERALPLAEEALRIFKRFEQPYGIAVAHQALGEAYLALGQLETAEKFAQAALKTEETGTVPDVLRILGEIKLAQQEYQAATDFMQQAIQAARENKDQYLEAYAWRALGSVEFAKKDVEEAKAALKKAFELFDDLKLPQENAKTQDIWVKLFPQI